MTDRELLEKAAKAAGIKLTDHGNKKVICYYAGWGGPWNPLTDDGDAFRLAVKLGLQVFPDDFGKLNNQAMPGLALCTDGSDEHHAGEDHGTDPYAATRRAIVRAAASIGETP